MAILTLTVADVTSGPANLLSIASTK